MRDRQRASFPHAQLHQIKGLEAVIRSNLRVRREHSDGDGRENDGVKNSGVEDEWRRRRERWWCRINGGMFVRGCMIM